MAPNRRMRGLPVKRTRRSDTAPVSVRWLPEQLAAAPFCLTADSASGLTLSVTGRTLALGRLAFVPSRHDSRGTAPNDHRVIEGGLLTEGKIDLGTLLTLVATAALGLVPLFSGLVRGALVALVFACMIIGAWVYISRSSTVDGARRSLAPLIDLFRPRTVRNWLPRIALTRVPFVVFVGSSTFSGALLLRHDQGNLLYAGGVVAAVSFATFTTISWISYVILRRSHHRWRNLLVALPEFKLTCLDLDRQQEDVVSPSAAIPVMKTFLEGLRRAILVTHDKDRDDYLSIVLYEITPNQVLKPCAYVLPERVVQSPPVRKAMEDAIGRTEHALFSLLYESKSETSPKAAIVGSTQAFEILRRATNHTPTPEVQIQDDRDHCPVWLSPNVPKELEASFDRRSYIKADVASVIDRRGPVPEFSCLFCLMVYSTEVAYFTEYDRALTEMAAFYLEQWLSRVSAFRTRNTVALELMAGTIRLTGNPEVPPGLFQPTGPNNRVIYRNRSAASYWRQVARLRPAVQQEIDRLATSILRLKPKPYDVRDHSGERIGAAVTCGGDHVDVEQVPALLQNAKKQGCLLAVDSILFRMAAAVLASVEPPHSGKNAFLKIVWESLLDKHTRRRLLGWFLAYRPEWRLVLELPAAHPDGASSNDLRSIREDAQAQGVAFELCLVARDERVQEDAMLAHELGFEWLKLGPGIAGKLPDSEEQSLSVLGLKIISMGISSATGSPSWVQYLEFGDPARPSEPPRISGYCSIYNGGDKQHATRR